jgi:hypothetical protein
MLAAGKRENTEVFDRQTGALSKGKTDAPDRAVIVPVKVTRGDLDSNANAGFAGETARHGGMTGSD